MKEPLVTQLASRRFVLVTGKGGTGKSCFSLALARALSAKGKKIWLVEVARKSDDKFTRLAELAGLKQLGHKPEALKNFYLSRLDPRECLSEYLSLKIPGGRFAALLLRNRVTSTLLDIVPGLSDIVTLGKIWYSLSSSRAEFKPDIVILDGPSSGHALSLFLSPQNFARLTRQGPLFEDARKMENFFYDPAQSAISFIATPEPLPLKEAEEFRKSFAPHDPYVVINKIFYHDPAANAQVDWAHAALAYRAQRQEREQELLREFSKSEPSVKLPFLFPSAKSVDVRLGEILYDMA